MRLTKDGTVSTKQCVDYLVYIVVRLVISVVQALPLATCVALTRPLVWLAADALKIRRKVLEENLRHAFPEMMPAERHQLIRKNWEHLLLMVIEIAHAMRKIQETNWRRYVKLANQRALVGAMLDERPTVIVSAHFGNFEISGQIVGLFGFKSFTVARPLDNPYLDRMVNQFRSSNGQHVLAKQGSAGELDELLEEGGILTVLGDQSAGPKGCWIDFFNRPASTHKAISLFVLAHDAQLVVVYSRRLGEALQLEIGTEAVLDPRDSSDASSGVREVTTWYTQRLEDVIRRDPEQYWWIHRRWERQSAQTPPFRSVEGRLMPDWIQIATTADCPPGASIEVVASERVIAVYNVDGEYFALDGVCPHQGGPLGKGALTENVVTCPWHGWQFDVRDGHCEHSPSVTQPRIELRVEGDAILAHLEMTHDA